MTLHYSDPNLEPRDCPNARRIDGDLICNCPDCKCTGRLGEEGAEPEIRIRKVSAGMWTWDLTPQAASRYGPPYFGATYSTEAGALAAAREAVR